MCFSKVKSVISKKKKRKRKQERKSHFIVMGSDFLLGYIDTKSKNKESSSKTERCSPALIMRHEIPIQTESIA